jgi:CHAT domain-containing protein/Flp pilus assembly protein TadD
MNVPVVRLVMMFALCLPWATVSGEKSAGDDDTTRRTTQADQLFEQGHTTEAKEICESLIQTLPPTSEARAFALNLLSKIYASEGDYDRAINSAQLSADAYKKINDPSGQSHALNNKGIAELQNGSYAAAELDLSEALNLSRSGQDVENQVQVLNNLGSAYFFRGSYSEASGDYEQALNLIRSNHSAPWSDYWLQITKFNQATLLQRLGRYDSAMQAYLEVERSSKALSGNDRAHFYANLGTLYRRLGDPYKALDAYRMAQKLYSTQHDADGEIAVLKNIGIAYALDFDDFQQAARIFGSTLALAQKIHNRREEMQAHLYLGETLLRSHSMDRARMEFIQAGSLATELATPEERWKSLYGIGQIEAAEGNREAAERTFRDAISLIEQTRSQLQLSALRSDFFADKREVYDALISILMKKNDLKEGFLFLERSRSRNFQDRLKGNQTVSAPTLQEAQAKLPEATALIEFWIAGDQVGFIWCTHEQAGIELGKLTAAQQTRIQMVLGGMPNNLKGSPDEIVAAFAPIFPSQWPWPATIQHLVIVPDGWSTYLPFDLLRAENDKAFFLQGCDISYLPSAAFMFRNAARPRIRWPWERELVAFGDPLPHDSKGGGDESENNFAAQRLAYSGMEIDDVVKLSSGTVKVFAQSADLKEEFLGGAANTASVLHISTHAFADGNSPENSRLLFSSKSAASPPSYVFLRELYDLDLTRVELATISACDTERGKLVRGEGAQTFSRALLSAGAASSVTTLWRVNDQTTAEFMKLFYYFLLREHLPKAEALRRTKLKLLNSKSNLADPAVWAAFVLNGDGRSPMPRVISWSELSAATVLLLSLIFLAARSLRSGGRGHR